MESKQDPPPGYVQNQPAYGYDQGPQGYGGPGYGPNPGYGQMPPPQAGYYPQGGAQQSTVVLQQPTPTSTVIIQQQGKPPNYLGLAIFVCLCISPICGIPAIIFSVLADNDYSDGNIEQSRSKGRTSMWLSISGIILSVVVAILIVALYYGGIIFTYRSSYNYYYG